MTSKKESLEKTDFGLHGLHAKTLLFKHLQLLFALIKCVWKVDIKAALDKVQWHIGNTRDRAKVSK